MLYIVLSAVIYEFLYGDFVLEIEPRASNREGKHFSPKLYFQPLF